MSRIFVVDDEDSILTFCQHVFTKDGYEVTTFSSGDEILKTVASNQPDLILMDLHIPGEKGLSLLNHIAQEKNKRIPVVIFSAYVTQDIEKEAYAAGAIDVISKDIETSSLRSRIRKIIQVKHRLFGESESEIKKQKILVIDDEEGIRSLLQDFFESNGYVTITAPNGEEGVALVEREHPTMILLDVTMPGMNGIETLRKIRAIDSSVGVVMATSIRDERVVREAAELGAHAYVLKPFDMKYLQLVVLSRLIVAS